MLILTVLYLFQSCRYMPFLIVSNGIYLFLLLGRGVAFPSWNILGIVLTEALQLYSYFGILDAASVAASKTRNKDLVGGQHLDWLGLTLFVQFASVLHSTKWFFLIISFPIISVWSLYSNLFGAKRN